MSSLKWKNNRAVGRDGWTRARVNVGRGGGADSRAEEKFAPGTPAATITLWQVNTEAKLREAQERSATTSGTLAGELPRALKQLTHLESIGSIESHMKAWKRLYPRTRLRDLADDPELIRLARNEWLKPDPTRENPRVRKGYSPKSINNMVQSLVTVLTTLTKERPTWVTKESVKIEQLPKREVPIRTVSVEKRLLVANNLLAMARAAQVEADAPLAVSENSIQRYRKAQGRRKLAAARAARYMKARARHMLLSTVPVRPVDLMRTPSTDVCFAGEDDDYPEGVWYAGGSKGGDACAFAFRDNDDVRVVWEAIRDAGAWGDYDTSDHAKMLYEAGWPKNIRPYNNRHSLTSELDDRGADAEDLQAAGRWKRIDMPRKHYAALQRSKRAGKAMRLIAGQFNGWQSDAAAPTLTPPPVGLPRLVKPPTQPASAASTNGASRRSVRK